MTWRNLFNGWFEATDLRLDGQGALNTEVLRRLDVVERWLANMDAVVWKLDQATQSAQPVDWTSITENIHTISSPQAQAEAKRAAEVRDLKGLADKIRSEMTAIKKTFPATKEELQ